MGANGATTTPYTLSGILQFLSVSTSVTFGGNVLCAALTATASAGNNARIAVNNAGPIGAGGYNGYEFYETGVLKAVQYWDPSAARVTINAPFTLSSTAPSTSTTTGALVVGGGIGVGGTLNCSSGGAVNSGVVVSGTYAGIHLDGGASGSDVNIKYTKSGQAWSVGASVGESTNNFVWYDVTGGAKRMHLTSAGVLVVTNKITTLSAVPASFADLAAVRTWLAAQFT